MICRILLFSLILLTSAPAGLPPHPGHYEKAKLGISKTAPPESSTPVSSVRRNPPRFVDRKIQALRQENLLVRNRKRTWTEVLLVCEPPRIFQTGYGLHPTRVQGTGRFAYFKLQIRARNVGRNLRHQSRVIVPSRGVIISSCRLFARQRSPCLVFL